MYTWVIYDIVNDKIRLKIHRACQRAGLQAIQKSVFLGISRKRAIKQLREDIVDIMNEKEDRIYLFSLTKEAFEQIESYGIDFDKSRLNPKSTVLFF